MTTKVYRGIVSQANLQRIHDELIRIIMDEKIGTEKFVSKIVGEGTYAVNNMSYTLDEINLINEKILRDFKGEYQFTHSYTRIYFADNFLVPHYDKENMDLTLTVNIHGNRNDIWPIHFSKVEHTFTEECSNKEIIAKVLNYTNLPFETVRLSPGDGACCTRSIIHWRYPYKPINPEDYIVQTFFHWKKV